MVSRNASVLREFRFPRFSTEVPNSNGVVAKDLSDVTGEEIANEYGLTLRKMPIFVTDADASIFACDPKTKSKRHYSALPRQRFVVRFPGRFLLL